MGFDSAFKGLKVLIQQCLMLCLTRNTTCS